MTDSGTKCAWMIHESKAVQIHVHNKRRCLYVPRVPGSVKNPHNNNNNNNNNNSFSLISKEMDDRNQAFPCDKIGKCYLTQIKNNTEKE